MLFANLKKLFPYVLTLLAIVLVQGCEGNVKRKLGISRTAPDEYKVIATPPLIIPPHYDLRPPSEYEVTSDKASVEIHAKEKVFDQHKNGRSNKVSEVSQGERLLLDKAGSYTADPHIRHLLKQESSKGIDEENEGWLHKLSSWRPKAKEPLVAPAEEKKRIEQNKRLNKPVTEGEIPTTVEKPSVIDTLLNK